MTSDNVTEAESVKAAEPQPAKKVDDQLIDELVGRAQAEGLQLTGEGGLLQQLTKRLLESALGERQDPAGGQGSRALPERAGRVEVRLHGDHVARPHGQGAGSLDHALEDRPERLRHHLRRPALRSPSVTSTTLVTPFD